MSAIPFLSGVTKEGVRYGIRFGTGTPSPSLGYEGEVYCDPDAFIFWGPKGTDWGDAWGPEITNDVLEDILRSYALLDDVYTKLEIGDIHTDFASMIDLNDPETIYGIREPTETSPEINFRQLINPTHTLESSITLEARNLTSQNGQTGIITLTQDSIGGHGVSFSTDYVFSPSMSLPTAANAIVFLEYFIINDKVRILRTTVA